MKYLVDYHVHTDNSFDGKVSMAEQCEKAIEIGLKEIVFTEHYDLNPNDKSKGFFNYEKYSREIEECRQKYGDKLIIKKGLELGEPHLYTAEHDAFIKDRDFDFLLGSVHFLDDILLDADFGLPERELYLKYFSEILELAKTGEFHTLGHIDVLKRYVPPHFKKFLAINYEEIIREILTTTIKRGKGIEINTSGFRQGLGEPLPAVEILEWFYELGGEVITIGSDAHHSKDLGQDLERGINVLRDVGFKAISTFSQGKINFIDI